MSSAFHVTVSRTVSEDSGFQHIVNIVREYIQPGDSFAGLKARNPAYEYGVCTPDVGSLRLSR
jgi:hypothetical protein